MLHAVILAGGSGTRFWPQSRRALSKQFLQFGSDRTLLQETVDRCRAIVPIERIWIVTGESHSAETVRQLPELTSEHVLVEPCGRNTAPCIGLAAIQLLAVDPDAVMLVMPADHVIRTAEQFQRTVEQPLGNRCDMVLLNSSLPCGAALRDLLSHEVAHAACISQRVQHLPLKSVDEQDWVSEGLAHLAEPTGTNSAERIATFLDDPSRHPLVVPDYYRAGLWRDPGCRGATVLFSKWCVEKHGPGFCGRLAQSTNSGTRSFEQATSLPFENLFRQWSLSLAEGHQVQSLSQCGRVGGQQFAGIRRHHWDVGSGDLSLPIRGTAIAVVELQSDASLATTICIEGDSTACWQFSIQRIPASGAASALRFRSEHDAANSPGG